MAFPSDLRCEGVYTYISHSGHNHVTDYIFTEYTCDDSYMDIKLPRQIILLRMVKKQCNHVFIIMRGSKRSQQKMLLQFL